MKAIVIYEAGGPEKLIYTDVPTPKVKPGWSLVRVTGLLGGKWTLDDFDPLEDMPVDGCLTAFHSGNANEAKIQEMLDFVKTYSVDVKPEKVFQLSEMRKAHEYLGSSRSFGKVVVMSE